MKKINTFKSGFIDFNKYYKTGCKNFIRKNIFDEKIMIQGFKPIRL